MKRSVGVSMMMMMVFVMAAAGCGSSANNSSDTTSPSKSETTSSSITSTTTPTPLSTEAASSVVTTATPSTAPAATYAVVEGLIDTPAEAAQALVDAGVTCDRYQDEAPNSSPPHLAGSCESGDSVIFFSVWQGDAAAILDAMLTSTDFKLSYKNSGRTEVNSVVAGNHSYGVGPLDHVLRNGGVPTDAERQLLNQIVDATGGQLKTWNY